jgi:hypothetical protein
MLSVDVDECDKGTDMCSQNCYNNNGSHTCGCNVGHALNANGHSCDGKCRDWVFATPRAYRMLAT